jgi:ubiquitin-like modifier-activating enzyme ATG7
MADLKHSRESRWLPTVISSFYNKICIAVALGFDSFLVVRHGSRASEDRLGCYFCNDVVGPRNSLTDRTLDQQCTVTRPGLSYQASAVAVELLVGLLQHPEKHGAAHGLSTPLGVLPHQIRGNFSSFSIAQFSSSAFSRCTACSDIVVQRFKEEKFEFVKSTCNDPEYLEEICGLKELANVNEDDLIEIDDLED